MLCRIGEIEVWRILEINAPFRMPEELFPDAGPEVGRIIEDLVPGQICATSGKLILPVQGFLLKTPNHVILVDACVGNDKTVPTTPDWHQRSGNRFMAALTAAGIAPDDVDYVLCTHLHVDHVGWNTRLKDGRWVPTFPNARYLLPGEDVETFGAMNTPSYQESVAPVIAAGQAERVTGGHKLGDNVTLIPTPGHTPGHVSIQIDSLGARAVITGDAIHTTAQCWHPEWIFKFDSDPEQAKTSRRALLESLADSDTRVLGSHFKLPSIGRISVAGDAFEWTDDS